MLPFPKIVVVDDERSHMQAVVDGLNELGTVALGVHYSEERSRGLPRCPGLRLLFLDLYLSKGSDSDQQIKTTVGLLPDLLTRSSGPYAIILWSRHADEYEKFKTTVFERLPMAELPPPLEIIPLDKVDHINGDQEPLIANPEFFREAIHQRINKNPVLAAILGWEEHVSTAADDTIREIFKIARRPEEECNLVDNTKHVLQTLASRSSAGVEGARQEAFRASNEVLIQVLTDRLVHRGTDDETQSLWQEVISDMPDPRSLKLEKEDHALLNELVHIESGDLLATVKPWQRGSAVKICEEEEFKRIWRAPKSQLLGQTDFGLDEVTISHWLMIQVQPPCDQAQQRSGLLPYILATAFKPSSNTQLDKLSKAKHLWLSPSFMTDGAIHHLACHLRFVTGLSKQEVSKGTIVYRLRESLLAELTHEMRSYGGRPGIVRFD